MIAKQNSFTLLASNKEGKAGKNVIRDLMEQFCKALKGGPYEIENPNPEIQSITDMNYYLFGVNGLGIESHLKKARGLLIQKFENKVEIFNRLIKVGLENDLLKDLFKEIESQWQEDNKVIDNHSVLVLNTLNGKKIHIEVYSSVEKEEKENLSFELTFHGEKEDTAKEFPKEEVKHIARDFASQIVKVLADIYKIDVPTRLENLKQINSYLFGTVSVSKYFYDLHRKLIQKVKNTKDIFEHLLEEGMKNPILKDKFEKIKSQWNIEGKETTEYSFFIGKLNQHEVIIKAFPLKKTDNESFVDENLFLNQDMSARNLSSPIIEPKHLPQEDDFNLSWLYEDPFVKDHQIYSPSQNEESKLESEHNPPLPSLKDDQVADEIKQNDVHEGSEEAEPLRTENVNLLHQISSSEIKTQLAEVTNETIQLQKKLQSMPTSDKEVQTMQQPVSDDSQLVQSLNKEVTQLKSTLQTKDSEIAALIAQVEKMSFQLNEKLGQAIKAEEKAKKMEEQVNEQTEKFKRYQDVVFTQMSQLTTEKEELVYKLNKVVQTAERYKKAFESLQGKQQDRYISARSYGGYGRCWGCGGGPGHPWSSTCRRGY